MDQRGRRDQYPWWVRFSLVGARTRNSQWFWVGLSLVVGALLLVFAREAAGPAKFVYLFAAAWALVAAGLYWSTIRWMDRHGTWS